MIINAGHIHRYFDNSKPFYKLFAAANHKKIFVTKLENKKSYNRRNFKRNLFFVHTVSGNRFIPERNRKIYNGREHCLVCVRIQKLKIIYKNHSLLLRYKLFIFRADAWLVDFIQTKFHGNEQRCGLL